MKVPEGAEESLSHNKQYKLLSLTTLTYCLGQELPDTGTSDPNITTCPFLGHCEVVSGERCLLFTVYCPVLPGHPPSQSGLV